ncbi:hypothetical protein LJR235_004975 [Pararhizobium sp. LjRoot235]|uniref:hypothetical protein n=1 Tax=Pararhizobium sp. LjRoot235 TaxID=3342291 RepID=UPI003ECC2035
MATTANRVSAQTSVEINRRLRWQMEERLAYYEVHPDQFETRLAELDRECDIERMLPHWPSREAAVRRALSAAFAKAAKIPLPGSVKASG